MTIADVLALPRATAFREGLLVPIAPWRRKEHGIPFPVRLTPGAWEALVAYPGPYGGAPERRSLDPRLDHALTALAAAIHNVGAVTFCDRTMTVLMPSWVGPPRPHDNTLQIIVVTTPDENGNDTLTVMLREEAPTL